MRGFILAVLIYAMPLCAFAQTKQLKHHWGAERGGVRVSLALDKLTYKVGEDIPLHIAAQVLSPPHPVYAIPDIPRVIFGQSSFAQAFHLTILDADGVPVGNERRSNLWLSPGIVGGPTMCPVPIPPNEILPLEVSSKRLWLLPTQPGTYRLTVSWSPYRERVPPCRMGMGPQNQREVGRFTVVSSVPITIHIFGKAAPTPGIPEVPLYTGWKSEFRIVNTPLGEATALEDRRTHLQWLRLSIIKDISDERLQSEMGKSGWLAGWRFATKDELHSLLRNFTGTPEGRSSDPALERALQRLLGGPTSTVQNQETGWSRRATYAYLAGMHAVKHGPCRNCEERFNFNLAYIAEDTDGGRVAATIDPDQQGWSISRFIPRPGIGGAVLLVRTAPKHFGILSRWLSFVR